MTRWRRWRRKYLAIRFLDRVLRGSSQVVFMSHPVSGLVFLLAIGWGAGVTTALGALWGLVVATAFASWLRVDQESLNEGMYGYNALLVGVAAISFLGELPEVWALIALGSVFSTVFFMAFANVMRTWEVPALTAPFILVGWLLLLLPYNLENLPVQALAAPSLPSQPHYATGSIESPVLYGAKATLNGVAQVFLVKSPTAGALMLLGIGVASPLAAALTLAGSLVATTFGLFLGAPIAAVGDGLYSFSPVLTALALGCIFYKPSSRVLVFALIATLATVVAQAALDSVVLPLGIPTLTFPFVLTAWLFLLAKGDLAPQPHSEVSESAFGSGD